MRHPVLSFIILIAVAAFVLAYAGILSFENSKNKAGVTIDKSQLKQQSQQIIDKTKKAGGKLLRKAGDELHKAENGAHAPPQPSAPTGNKPAHQSDHGGGPSPGG